MKINQHHLFVSLSIAIVYCVCTHELIYTSQYQDMLAVAQQDENKEYYKLENKYRVTMGEENPAGSKAEKYFHETYIPQMFRSCTSGYYSIFHHTESHYEPPTINKWYEAFYKSGTTTYYSTYTIEGYASFKYNHEIYKQTSDAMIIKLNLHGTSLRDGKQYYLASFYVMLDYAFEVLKVEQVGSSNQLPIFGSGKTPSSYSCEYLQANIGRYLN